MSEIKRKLARVEAINGVSDIPNADNIQLYTVGGWNVVGKKHEFAVGDKVIFFEIDAFVPHEIAPFLTLLAPLHYKGIAGNPIRTRKIRSAVSQGLILPITDEYKDCEVGFDLTEALGIVKYEKIETSDGNPDKKGDFPAFLQKNDQERIQNCYERIMEFIEENPTKDLWQVEEKLEGSSVTVARFNGEVYLCSKNLRLDEDNPSSDYTLGAKELLNLAEHEIMESYAIQGELIGRGIQGNIYNQDYINVRAFDVFDIKKGKHLTPDEREEFIDNIAMETNNLIQQVPIIEKVSLIGMSLEEIIEMADGISQLASTYREGIVLKNCYENITFKVISNKYLLKGG